MWKSNFDDANSTDDGTDTDDFHMDSERVMKEIQYIYRKKSVGLIDAARAMSERNFRLTMPHQKITVLIVGSHAAAKKKFLDLYFSDSRQVSGGGFISKVNYDKLDKIYITHGNQRRMLIGETVLDYCPHLAQLKNVPGLKDYLTTEIASRNTKSLVSFILAPECVPTPSTTMSTENIDELIDDNNNSRLSSSTKIVSPVIKQSLDMQNAIEKLTEASDLIFIFFDPTGTTTPKETMQPFNRLWEKHHEKIMLLLARAVEDECNEDTREEVLTQMVREIWRNPTVKNVGYLPEIYCPNLASGIRDDERLWNVIQNTADQSIERTLVQLDQDATNVKMKLEKVQKRNENAKKRALDLNFVYIQIAMLILFTLLLNYGRFGELKTKIAGQDFAVVLKEIVTSLWFIGLVLLIAFASAASYFHWHFKPAPLTEDEENLLNKRLLFVNHALYRKEVMQKCYTGMDL